MIVDAQKNIRNATELRKNGNLEGAFDSYQIALTLLLDMYKSEDDIKRKTEIGELVEVIALMSLML